MELSLILDPNAHETLQGQVFEQVRRMILNGQLRPGMMLPASRQLAERIRVSRNTVTLAYERLVAEGYIEAHGTAGTFISLVLPDDLLHAGVGLSGDPRSSASRPNKPVLPSPLLCFAGYPVGAFKSSKTRPVFDFWVGRSEPSSFPIEMWRRIVARKLSTTGFHLTEYGDPAGLEELRVAIVDHLGRARGMSVTMDQVIITNGSQDGLNLICQLFDRQKHPFYIENPCYKGAVDLFQNIGAELCPIPVDENGLIAEKLPRGRAGILFVTPSHQYPTGATLSLQRRLHILRWAEETNSFIIEDDYDSDFRYDGPPLTALAGLDRSRRVLYLGTFSKSLGAGLRLGYAVVPKELAGAARILKCQMSNGQSWLDQAVLAEFIQKGHFDRHLRRARLIYKARRDCLKSSLEQNFGVADIDGADGGLHVVWRLPPGSPPASVVERAAQAKSIGVYALHSGGAHDFDHSSKQDVLVLGYSSLKETEIRRAVNDLRELLDELRNESCFDDPRTEQLVSEVPKTRRAVAMALLHKSPEPTFPKWPAA